MATVQLTQHNFSAVVENNRIVLIEFWAPWCSSCTAFTATLTASSECHSDAVFATVNTDEQQALAGAAAITSVPTLLVIKAGQVVHRQRGAVGRAVLEAMLDELDTLG